MTRIARSAVGATLLALSLSGCVNGFWFGIGPKEGVIKPSLKPYEPPVMAPVSAVTPEPFKPDPPLSVDPRSGQLINKETGAYVAGTATAHTVAHADFTTGQVVDKVTGKTFQVKDPTTGQMVDAAIDPLSGNLISSTTKEVIKDADGKPIVVSGDTVVDSPAVVPSALPSSDANASLSLIDGTRVQYVDAGNTLFLETRGLAPSAAYTAVTTWPNGRITKVPFHSDSGGNISGPQGKFLEFPHSGFYELQLQAGKPGVVTGDFRIDLQDSSGNTAQTIYYNVRPRPVIFATTKDLLERTVYFSDRPDEVYLHGEGLPPGALVSVYVITDDVNRFNPLTDGTTISDKVFENINGLRYKADDQGMINERVLTWATRQPVPNSLVVIGKYLNSDPAYKASEDLAIIDHPTFVIKSGAEFFASVQAAGTPIYTPSPSAAP